MTQEVKVFKLFDQSVLVPLDTYGPGIETFDFKVFSGSRILTTLFVKSIDPGASVSIEVLNNFSVDGIATWDSILSFSSNTLGHTKRIITDFNKFFQYKITITGGDVEFAIAISVFDNAATTVIENAEIDVNLSDKTSGLKPYDITRIGDGTRELKINGNDEVKVHDQDALDKLQQVVDAVTGNPLPTGSATAANQALQIAEAQDINVKLDDLLQGQTDQSNLLDDINSELDLQTTALSLLNAKDFSTSAKQDIGNDLLTDVKNLLSNPLPLPTGASTEAKQDDQIVLETAANALLSNILTEAQLNLKQKILKAVDRQMTESYADFGTKDQRIIQLDYTAPSVGVGPGFTARKVINYVLDGNRYRRTITIWSII
jgi:hypothetical protein